ncbi:MAG: CopD family protein [Longimicrobiales bacterium]|nr:CopD family protein [Longimicrobiales bacterium]
MNPVASAAVGWLYFASVTLGVGAVVFHLAILPRACRAVPSLDHARVARRVARVGAAAAAAIAAGLAGLLVRQAGELRFPGDPLSVGLDLVEGTPWWTAWSWGVAGCAVAVGGFTLAARGRGHGAWAAGVGLIPLVLLPGLTGHASDADAGIVALVADALHVTAASAWIGGLGVLLLAGRGVAGRGAFVPLVRAFSPVAIASVTLLVASGALASWRIVQPWSAYWTTPYGRTLLLKVGLFGVVALFGLWNWRRGTPGAGDAPDGGGAAALRRSAAIEFTLAQIVLVVTAVLVRTSP